MINKLLGDPYWQELASITERFVKNKTYSFNLRGEDYGWYDRFSPEVQKGLKFLSGIIYAQNDPTTFWNDSDCDPYLTASESDPSESRKTLLSLDPKIIRDHLVWHYIRKHVSQTDFKEISNESDLQKIFDDLVKK